MDLREYLFKHRIKIVDFAKSINYGRGYINEVVCGTRIPGRKLAALIENATEGKVKASVYMRRKRTVK